MSFTEEYLDLCDDAGVLTGVSLPRSVVHREGHLHKTIHLWLSDERGRLLIQKRHDSKRSYPGRWDVSVAGHISSGDSPESALVREAAEELGITVHASNCTLLGTFRQSLIMPEHSYSDNELTLVYAIIVSSDIVITMQESEVTDVRWEEAPKLEMLTEELENAFVPHPGDHLTKQ